jgi:tetratricopeptide (TPR) repeat protein
MSDPQENIPEQVKNIIYISIPDNLGRRIGEFEIDPTILLPVETPPGDEEFHLHSLSWEMIIAAMLKILAYQPEHRHADYYRRFIKAANPGIVAEMTQTAIFKAKNRDFDIAEEIFRALANLEPQEISNTVNLALVEEQHAQVYEQIGNEELKDAYLETAFLSYKEALRRDPESPDVHYHAGTFFLRQNNFRKAEEHLTRYLGLGTEKKRIAEVKDILEEIKNHKNLDTLFKEAYDFIRIGKEEEGIKKIKQFMEIRPDISNAWFLLGWACRRMEQYDRGKEAFRKALELGAEETDTLNELAICLMELGEYKESRKMLSKALKQEPENVKVISNLGILALKEENEEEALGFFKSVLEIAPDDPIARQYISFLDSK